MFDVVGRDGLSPVVRGVCSLEVKWHQLLQDVAGERDNVFICVSD